MKWYALLPMWATLNFASTATVTDPGATGGAGTSSGDGGAGGVGSGAASGGAGGGTQPAPSQINWQSAPAQFREAFDAQKRALDDLQKQYEPWKALNVKPEEIQSFQTGYQAVYGEIKGVADALDIPEQEVADAIRTHGIVKVLDFLRSEYDQAERAQSGDTEAQRQRELESRIQQSVEQAISPIQQRENHRMTTEANSLCERTINEMAADTFKKVGVDWTTAPEPLKAFVLTGATEALKYDDEGMFALKYEGKTAAVQKAFQTFMSMFDAAYLARRQMESKMPPNRSGGPGKTTPQGVQGKQPSLDDIIENPDLARTAGGRPAYST